jgi:polyribonucleotide nucleotidyltransferase
VFYSHYGENYALMTFFLKNIYNMYKVSIEMEGKEYSLEAGKFAKFANGSVMVRSGDTMVLVTATAGTTPKDLDFLPLSVEYREKMASAGKIPGGFLKREARPSTKEILVARLIDRPCRPLFPKDWNYETQIVANAFSAEPDVDPENLACLGTSAALVISNIPFNGPISEVRVGRLDGKFIANPSPSQLEECDIDITVAGTDGAINMVEGESDEISETEFLEAVEYGHARVKELNNLQLELAKLISSPKREYELRETPEEFVDFVQNSVGTELEEYVNKVTTKSERTETRRLLKEKAIELASEKYSDSEEYSENYEKYVGQGFGKLEKAAMRKMIVGDGKRLDGRKLDEVRPISSEVGLLPRVHGSALFTRGETQSLTTCTLGTKSDEQMVDGLLPTYTSKFYLHYNFPPYSVGETGRMFGVSRREIGHGNLAERALKRMIPTDKDFPYTVRIVSEILESNGSSSMATVCAGSMSMMNSGLPIKKAVSGIAMGLIMEDDKSAILSDILGDEDFLGDMDFKVAGTRDGITACQMDMKIEGITVELMKEALAQANEGRMHILDKMEETISEPAAELSQYAPRFTVMKIATDEIGAVIGSGGSVIREICADCDVEINIEDDGTVTIAATNGENAKKAQDIIEQLLAKPEVGVVYDGVVKELREGLGAFLEIMPKTVGLLHISQIDWKRVDDMTPYFKVGDTVSVKCMDVSPDGKMKLSRRELIDKPEGWVDRPPRPRGNDRGDRRGGRDDRGGRGGGDRRDSRPPRRDDRRSDNRDGGNSAPNEKHSAI